MLFNSNFRKGVFFTVIALFLFTACKQQPNDAALDNSDDNGGVVSDLSRIEWANEDAISIADAAGTFYNGAFMRSSERTNYVGDCATVATDTLHDPHTLVVRFGDTDCVCLDGRKRKGSIIVHYSGRYSDTAKVHTITFDNYFVNDNQLSGDIQLVRVDTTITGNSYYKVVVNDTLNMRQMPLNSSVISWRGNLVRKWVTGFASGNRGDDAFSVSGNATLTRPNGHAYSVAISAPFQVVLNCDYVEAGVANITGYKGARRIDYGSGGCDINAMLYIGVNSYPQTLTK